MPIKYTISNIKDTNSDIPNINVNIWIYTVLPPDNFANLFGKIM